MTVFIAVQNWPLEPPAHGPWGAAILIVLSAWGGFIIWCLGCATLGLIYPVTRAVRSPHTRP